MRLNFRNISPNIDPHAMTGELVHRWNLSLLSTFPQCCNEAVCEMITGDNWKCLCGAVAAWTQIVPLNFKQRLRGLGVGGGEGADMQTGMAWQQRAINMLILCEKCNTTLIWRPETAAWRAAGSLLHTSAVSGSLHLPFPPPSLPTASYKILKDYSD